MKPWRGAFAVLSLFLAAGCGGQKKDEVIDGVVLPNIEAVGWGMGVKHTHMHLVPGNTYEWQRETGAGTEITSSEVLAEGRPFPEVEATAVKTTVTLGGAKVRESTDWFAQDSNGAVWQFGKDECEYQGSSCVKTDRSWEWSGGDARPGFVLPAGLEAGGRPYYQVFWDGKIEDVGLVVSTGEEITVPAQGFSYKECVKIQQTSKLDASVNLLNHYCPIVGLTLQEDGNEKMELTHFQGI